MTNISKTKVVLYILGIFVAGALAGGFGGYSMARQDPASRVRPDELADRIKKRMQTKLNLTAEQMKEIEPSVQKVCAQLRMIGHNSALETSKAFDRFNQQIADFLTAEQEAELDKFQLERKESVKRRCRSWTNDAPAKAVK
jgi:hypothetical protein